MVRQAFFLVPVAFLAGCGGGSSGGGGFNTDNVVGRSFADQAATVENTGSRNGPVGNESVSVRFISRDSVQVTVGGNTSTLFRDPSDDSYSDVTDETVLFVATSLQGAPATPDVLYFVLGEEGGIGADDRVLNFVGGNQTALADMPTTGTATYRGTVGMQDGTLDAARGALTLTANFGTGGVTGAITGGFPADETATFLLVPTAITGRQFSTELTSTDVTIVDSQFDGDFYGNGASQVAGTVLIDAVEGNASGVFGAAR